MPVDADAGGPRDGALCVPGDGLALRYAASSIRADLARGGFGLACVVALLAAAAPPAPVVLALAGLAALFAAFLRQTWRRGRSTLYLRADGLTLVSGERRRSIAWRELDHLRLRWFGPRRQGAGWLDLELAGGGERLSLTSGLSGFQQVLEQAVAAAERNGIELAGTSRANIALAREARTPAGSSALRG